MMHCWRILCKILRRAEPLPTPRFAAVLFSLMLTVVTTLAPPWGSPALACAGQGFLMQNPLKEVVSL